MEQGFTLEVMRIVARTWLAFSLTLGLAVTLPSPASQAAGEACQPTAALSRGTLTKLTAPAGVELKTWQFATGLPNSSGYPTLLSLVRSSGTVTTLKQTISKIGDSANQKSMAQAASALAYVNGNYYDFNTYQPEGPIAVAGKYWFAKPGVSRAVGLEVRAATSTTGISGNGLLKQSARKITVKGLNLSWLKTDALTAYTSTYGSASLPSNSYAILVANGKVARKYLHGVKNRPQSGTVLVAKGTAVNKLKAFAVGRATSLSLPTGTVVQPNRDQVTPDIKLIGTIGTIQIQAMNYLNANQDADLVVFDSHWSGGAPQSPVTLVLSSNGTVTSVQSSIYGGSVPSGGYLVKAFTALGVQQLAAVNVGTKFTVRLGWTPASGKTYENLLSYHNLLVSSGNNVALCTPGAEVIRPRTAIGWDSQGQLMLLTSTMGKHWNDGGYRLGGASLHQMGDWLVALGAVGGVGLDGGGSTTMYVKRSGVYDRIDLPDSEWVRSIPQGVALTSR